MKPTGPKDALLYFLGEGPGKVEIQKQRQFVGKAGRVLRFRIPEEWEENIRWNNVVRSRPTKVVGNNVSDREPSPVEIECCRPSIIRDIELVKPKAVVGFGNVPLMWATGNSGITMWHGRRVPVKIGNHTCWFYPILHPSYINRTRKYAPIKQTDYGSEDEFTFALALRRIFSEIRDLPDAKVHDEAFARANIETVDGSGGDNDVKKIREFLHSLYDTKIVGLDYETQELRPYWDRSRILSIALSSEERTMAFALRHDSAGWTDKQLKEVEKDFKDFLYNARCRKVVHNLAFEMEWTAEFFGRGALRAQPWGDSLSQAYLIDQRVGMHSLDTLCYQHFGVNIKSFSNVDRKQLWKEPLDKILPYNGIDAKYHRLLYIAQKERIKLEGLQEVYKHQLRRIPTAVLTQRRGIPIDQTRVKEFYAKYKSQQKAIEEKIEGLKIVKRFREQKGYDFRPSANKDIKYALVNLAGIDVDKVDKDALASVKHPLANNILEWRTPTKILSTYIESVMEGSENLFDDGMLHPILNLCRTYTWRTSSDSPNIQNWPKRDKLAKEIRSLVKPGGRLRVVAFDYGQIQARNVGMESKDEALVKSFWDRYDIHADWARRIAKRAPEWVKEGDDLSDPATFKLYRDIAKNKLVFPLFFGAHPPNIAQGLKIPEDTCQDLFNDFWKMFPGVLEWHKRLRKQYLKHGYVTGHSGFKHKAPIAPNELINYPIQADESVIVCDAMCRLSELNDFKMQANMEIHDDLTFIWPVDEIEHRAVEAIDMMLNTPFDWARVVPIQVELSIGTDWANKQDAGKYESDRWEKKLNIPRELLDG